MTFNEIINSEKPVLVDFFAEWCGPCKMMPPILKQVKDIVKEDATILKIDVEKNPQVAEEYKVQSIPTLILFKDGKPVWRKSGVVQSKELVTAISDNINR